MSVFGALTVTLSRGKDCSKWSRLARRADLQGGGSRGSGEGREAEAGLSGPACGREKRSEAIRSDGGMPLVAMESVVGGWGGRLLIERAGGRNRQITGGAWRTEEIGLNRWAIKHLGA